MHNLFAKDGDGSIPRQKVGIALRAMMTYPSVGIFMIMYVQEACLTKIMKDVEDVDYEMLLELLYKLVCTGQFRYQQEV